MTLTTISSSTLIVSSTVERLLVKGTSNKVITLRSALYARKQVVRVLNILRKRESACTTHLRKARMA